MSALPARRGAVFWIAALATLGLLVVIVTAAVTGTPNGTLRPSVFSRAATGHAAFLGVLQRLGYPVVVSRNDTLRKIQPSGDLLVMAEPVATFGASLFQLDSATSADAAWRALIAGLLPDDRALLILPKRFGTKAHRNNGSWLDGTQIAPPSRAKALLEIALPGMEPDVVHRPTDAVSAPELETLGIDVDGPLQLIRGRGLEPIIAIGDAVLFGAATARSGATIYILADADLIANAGIGRGRNAERIVEIVDMARAERGIVIDETMHGFAQKPGIWDLALTFPFVLVPITLAVFSLVLIAAASSGRVGKLLTPPPPLKAGRKVLIAAAGDMLAQGHHDRFLLGRYARLIRRQISYRLSPQRAVLKEGVATVLGDVRLAELARSRGVTSDPSRLFGDAEAGTARDILPLAHDLFDFKERMIGGSNSARPGSGDRKRVA